MFGISGTSIKPGSKPGTQAAKPKKKITPVAKPARKPRASFASTLNKPKKKVGGKKVVKKVKEVEEKPPPKEEAPPPVNNNGQVTIRYNHYDKKFSIKNGSMTAEDIDNEYALLFAYPNAKLHLSRVPMGISLYHSLEEVKEAVNGTKKEEKEKAKSEGEGGKEGEGEKEGGEGTKPEEESLPNLVEESSEGVYQGLIDDSEYWVLVEEDAEERAKYEAAPKRTFNISDFQDAEDMGKRTAAADEITNELKKMSTDELKARGENYKNLVEARDLEDCLFGAG